jgi:hypothetical protein
MPRAGFYTCIRVGHSELDYADIGDYSADTVRQTITRSLFRLGLDKSYADICAVQVCTQCAANGRLCTDS